MSGKYTCACGRTYDHDGIRCESCQIEYRRGVREGLRVAAAICEANESDADESQFDRGWDTALRLVSQRFRKAAQHATDKPSRSGEPLLLRAMVEQMVLPDHDQERCGTNDCPRCEWQTIREELGWPPRGWLSDGLRGRHESALRKNEDVPHARGHDRGVARDG